MYAFTIAIVAHNNVTYIFPDGSQNSNVKIGGDTLVIRHYCQNISPAANCLENVLPIPEVRTQKRKQPSSCGNVYSLHMIALRRAPCLTVPQQKETVNFSD